MNDPTGKILLKTAAATLGLVCMTGWQANAGTLYNNWNYAIDSYTDGVTGSVVANNGTFEFYGLAVREEAENIFVALNANLPLTGYEDSGALNGSIAWGDLLFNFSDNDVKTASANGELFAIRFTPVNDSGVTQLGVYSNVTAKNVTQQNSGFENLQQYIDYVEENGGTPSMGDFAINEPYFEQIGKWTILTSIDSGTKVGDISFLDNTALSSLGLDFGYFDANGSETIGFSLSKNLLPSGNFIAHILAECANDGVALEGEFKTIKTIKDVPEPSTTAGITLVGLVLVGSHLYKRRQSNIRTPNRCSIALPSKN